MVKKKSKKNVLLKGGRAAENVRLKTKKGRKKSSSAWLERQLNDPFVKQAQIDGYRSRAVYKLIEIDEVFEIFEPWQKVVDLGAAPGGWCQYLARKFNDKGKIIGVDLLDIEPMQDCYFIKGDFTDEEVLEEIEASLDGKADVVLSDMAPNLTGHNKTDQLRIDFLLELALDFSIRNLKDGGVLIAKVFRGGTEKDLLDQVKKYFTKVKHFKPQASRKESAEMYMIAKGFRAEQARLDYGIEQEKEQIPLQGMESGFEQW
jgi:23S rRNA (uridine2552-2'-O)-methyltransferase